MRFLFPLPLVFLAVSAHSDLPQDEWEFEDGYGNDLLYVHALANYSWDLEAQFEWEQKRFVDNALRVNTGSVSSDRLLTDIDLGLNEQLNDDWRFFGRFERDGQRRRSVTTEQLLLGFERSIFERSAIFVALNPEYDKSFMDLAIGYALYGDTRENYLRVSLLLEDFNFDSKNDLGGTEQQQAGSVEWVTRWRLPNNWLVYSEGRIGQAYERRFDDAARSPELIAETQRKNRSELRFSRRSENGHLWSVWGEWVDFEDSRQFRTPGFDYDYSNQEFSLSVEHVRLLSERHRIRLLAHYIDRDATSAGFRGHKYKRQELVGGAFYERLRTNSGISIGYALGLPDFTYTAIDPDESYAQGEFSDKLILGYRYRFSPQAEIRASVSQEVSEQGFGGGAIQFQLFF